jgi:hypothetical protein
MAMAIRAAARTSLAWDSTAIASSWSRAWLIQRDERDLLDDHGLPQPGKARSVRQTGRTRPVSPARKQNQDLRTERAVPHAPDPRRSFTALFSAARRSSRVQSCAAYSAETTTTTAAACSP